MSSSAVAARSLHPSTVRLAVVTAILVFAASLVGCSSNLNMTTLGESISTGINDQLEMPIAAVTCPSDPRPIKAGDSFECIATPAAGGRLVVAVTQQDDQGNINWTVTKTEGLLDLRLAEAAVRDGLKERAGVDATVSCGGRWKAAIPGETFDCEVTAEDGQRGTAEVTTTTADGNITWSMR